MVDFLNLVRNENMKMFRRPRLYVMLGIITGLVLLVSTLVLFIANGVPDMWEVILPEMMFLYWLVTIFSVVASSGTVAEEFSSGTIKLLLIRPWSRSKVLLSKYISSLLFALFFTIVFFVSLLLINGLFFELFRGAAVADVPMDQLNETSGLTYMFKYFGLAFLGTVMTVTISFMLSTIFRSNVLAIAVALFIEIILNSFLQVLVFIEQRWVDYVLFVHLNLTKYVEGTVASDGMTLGFSLAVLAVYYVLFIAITWLIFNRRDVAS